VRSTQLVFPTSVGDNGATTTTNVGAIAGGVVGGAVALLAVVVLIFFCLKRRNRRGVADENFDGNFDPDRLDTERFGGSAMRPGAMPDVDLVGGAEISPFQYRPGAAPQTQDYKQVPQMSPQMGQRPGVPGPIVGGEYGHARSDVNTSTTGSHYPTTVTDPSVTGMQNMDFRGPSPGPSLATSGTLPSSKELASGGRRYHVANDEGGSGQRTSGIIVQHRDMGRVQQTDIPPSYDSISPDERDSAGPSLVSLSLDYPAFPDLTLMVCFLGQELEREAGGCADSLR
jgi:hypothetical protein